MSVGLHPGGLFIPFEEFIQTLIRNANIYHYQRKYFFNLQNLFLMVKLFSKPKRLLCFSTGKARSKLPRPVLLKLESFQLITALKST